MIQRACVGALLYNTQGEVLLQLRDDKPDLPYANMWTTFGGAVEAGEAPDEAIVRELQEELELELPLNYWKQYLCPVRTTDTVQTTIHVYVGAMKHDIGDLTLHEGQAMRYFSRDEALQLTLAFAQEFLLQEFYYGQYHE